MSRTQNISATIRKMHIANMAASFKPADWISFFDSASASLQRQVVRTHGRLQALKTYPPAPTPPRPAIARPRSTGKDFEIQTDPSTDVVRAVDAPSTEPSPNAKLDPQSAAEPPRGSK